MKSDKNQLRIFLFLSFQRQLFIFSKLLSFWWSVLRLLGFDVELYEQNCKISCFQLKISENKIKAFQSFSMKSDFSLKFFVFLEQFFNFQKANLIRSWPNWISKPSEPKSLIETFFIYIEKWKLLWHDWKSHKIASSFLVWI